MSYTIKNLRDVEDMAVKHGFSETQEARFPRGDLGAEVTGVAYHVLKPGKREYIFVSGGATAYCEKPKIVRTACQAF